MSGSARPPRLLLQSRLGRFCQRCLQDRAAPRELEGSGRLSAMRQLGQWTDGSHSHPVTGHILAQAERDNRSPRPSCDKHGEWTVLGPRRWQPEPGPAGVGTSLTWRSVVPSAVLGAWGQAWLSLGPSQLDLRSPEFGIGSSASSRLSQPGQSAPGSRDQATVQGGN